MENYEIKCDLNIYQLTAPIHMYLNIFKDELLSLSSWILGCSWESLQKFIKIKISFPFSWSFLYKTLDVFLKRKNQCYIIQSLNNLIYSNIKVITVVCVCVCVCGFFLTFFLKAFGKGWSLMGSNVTKSVNVSLWIIFKGGLLFTSGYDLSTVASQRAIHLSCEWKLKL